MTEEEREQILRMIAEGKITAEEGLKLMKALEEAETTNGRQVNDGTAQQFKESSPGGAEDESPRDTTPSLPEHNPPMERIKTTVRGLWQIPLWIGVAVILLSAWGMYALLQGPGINFWFYCLIAPLLLGVLLIAAGVGSRKARWMYVDIHQKPGEKPKHITFGFPLPLKLTAWFLRTFGNRIEGLGVTDADEVIQVLAKGFSGNEPLIVSLDEGKDGERVQIYIG
ncbi:MAG: inositol phosphorylceramide synthase regulatory subunit KEI1 [Anaerolineales bacterium]|nr:inositol phosphorylceramide synthase regulatory subunit KEI1 [Anaerolineales bacterium]MCX7609782.1 inositol phosphorylceramide synthase regulatory subunit KEI1 [Anaerolineales bacterium]MDW8226897.1 hypothetical protein [Anaerolineales bacterium]